jgi:hypothetical protein
VVADVDGSTLESSASAFETGAVPTGFPSVTVEVFDEELAHSGFLLTNTFTAPGAPVLLDHEGDYVWWYETDNGDGSTYSRTALSADGASVYAWTLNVHLGRPTETPALYEIDWGGTSAEFTELDDGHHDLVVHRDGTLAYLEYDERESGGDIYEGDRIMELAPDGTTTEIWSAWDDFEASGGGAGGVGGAGTNWSHANALDYNDSEGAYYISLLGFGGIAKIDRASGTLMWMLGGEDSDFVDSSGSTELFVHQHQFQRTDEGFVVFDNGDAERALLPGHRTGCGRSGQKR